MPGTAELSCPEAVESDGVLYVIGLRDGQYWIRRSADRGLTWLPYADGALEKAVAAAGSEQRAALVKLSTQGRPLLACVPDSEQMDVYVSWDDGETWTRESSV